MSLAESRAATTNEVPTVANSMLRMAMASTRTRLAITSNGPIVSIRSGDLFFGLFVAMMAVPLARVGLSGRWFTRFAIFTGVVYALGSLSITSPDAGVFGACEVIGTLLLLAWLAITSIRLLKTREGAAALVPASVNLG